MKEPDNKIMPHSMEQAFAMMPDRLTSHSLLGALMYMANRYSKSPDDAVDTLAEATCIMSELATALNDSKTSVKH